LSNAKFKRVLAERFIREFKLRVCIALDLENLKLHQWKLVMDDVVVKINAKQKRTSLTEQLRNFFLRNSTHHVPQQKDNLYKFNIGDQVITDLSRENRRKLNYKYSLFYGKNFFIIDFNSYKHILT